VYDHVVQARCSALLVLVVTAGCDVVLGLDVEGATAAPAVVTTQGANAEGVAMLGYPIVIAEGAPSTLLVSVHAGDGCAAPPSAIPLNHGGVPLAQVASLTGTPCGMGSTVTALWLLSAPPVGVADVELILTPSPGVVHSTAVALTGLDPADPVRDVGVAAGSSAASTVSVQSEVGDVVLSAIGQGSGIEAAGAPATILRIANVDSSHTTNNSAVSIAPGASPAVISTWSFTADDEWQTMAVSLRPAPP